MKFSGFELARIEDIFTDSKHPGEEIIAIHQQQSSTHSALRVYDLEGRVLYQVWVDAYISAVYWMSGPRLLVLAGSNGSAFWRERGYPDVQHTHPTVVFAVRPSADFVVSDYLAEQAGEDSLTPVW